MFITCHRVDDIPTLLAAHGTPLTSQAWPSSMSLKVPLHFLSPNVTRDDG